MSDEYIFVLLVSKIFSLCSKSRPHRPALHRTLVTLNNTFYQLIPSKKYIALHISFFSWRYVVSMLSVKKNFGGYYWWWLSVKAKAEKSLPRGHENTHMGPRIYFRKLLQFWILEILFFFILICSSKYTTPQWPSGLRYGIFGFCLLYFPQNERRQKPNIPHQRLLYLAKLFSRVMGAVQTLLLPKFVICYYSNNFIVD